MSNKTKSIALVGGLLAVFITLGIYRVITYPKPPKTESIPIKIAFPIQSLDATPIIIAQEKGYFKDQALNVDLMYLTSTEGTLAVGAGKVDIAVAGAAKLYGPIGKGVPIKIMSIISDMTSDLFVRPNSGIVNLKDLEGKKISFGPAGSGVVRFNYIFGKENADVKKIKVVEMDKLYLPSALMSQKVIDAAMIDEPAYADKARELGAVALPYWIELGYQNIASGASITINTDYLKGHEAEVTKFYNAMIEANRYMKEHLDDASVIITDYIRTNTNGAMNMKPADFAKQINDKSMTYVLWQDPTPLVDMAKISYDLKLSSKPLSLEDLFDLRFKIQLEKAQNEIYGTSKN
jgi:NitT/TauT family transport system substrate-binding protein